MSRYRTGRHLGRTIYRDDELIGIMDTPADGALVVELLNARERVQGALDRERPAPIPDPCMSCGGNRREAPPPGCLHWASHPKPPERSP